MAGIIGYGAYIPRNRIKVEEIAKIWGADAPSYKRGLGLEEKSVPSPDQDTITMTVEAARKAIRRAGINPRETGAVYVGSESHPYAVKPSGTVLAEAIGATPEVHSASLEFACKAGSEAMFVCLCQVESGRIKYGLAVGADTSQGAPGDALEYSAAAGAAAFLFGLDNVIAEVNETYSFMTDTPDFWRREYEHYPRRGDEATYALSAASDMEYEAYQGITFPGLYALMAQAHMARYGITRERLAHVAVKNHKPRNVACPGADPASELGCQLAPFVPRAIQRANL
jgi:hydroxymethylglutaryl-CoA synthase